MNFRHEWKHEIRFSDALALRSRLQAVMHLDPYAQNGKYVIRSLYLDNAEDTALKEKIDGAPRREKFRVRFYNGDLSRIVLEKKSKINDLCAKEQEVISLKQAKAIVTGEISILLEAGTPLLSELAHQMKAKGLRAKTIVEYTREPFVFAPGNVRVTLDYNIRTGLYQTDFLNPSCVLIPVRDAPIILEVKWDAYLPSLIRDLVQTPQTHSAAFSKYAACRMYG